MPTCTAFYVTARRTARGEVKGAWLLGPYETHDDATADIAAARRLAEDVDPRFAFDDFGTASITSDRPMAEFPIGRLGRTAALAEKEAG